MKSSLNPVFSLFSSSLIPSLTVFKLIFFSIDGSGSSDDSSDDDAESEKEVDTSAPILDQTETNIIALRRTIYLTIQSSLDFEETVHKLMKLNLKPGHEMELCHMVC